MFKKARAPLCIIKVFTAEGYFAMFWNLRLSGNMQNIRVSECFPLIYIYLLIQQNFLFSISEVKLELSVSDASLVTPVYSCWHPPESWRCK